LTKEACWELILWQREKVKENMSGLSVVSVRAGIIAQA
jgi:hypothetical protein